MPLPFILAGAAIIAGGYGIKKGIDAKNDFDDAEYYQNRAEREAKECNETLENQKNTTNSSLEKYGKTKKNGIDQITKFNSLICYPDGERKDNTISVPFKKKIIITHEEEVQILKELNILDSELSLKAAESKIKNSRVEMEKLSGALSSITSGSLTGLAAGGASYFGVGALASASTGTAISSLSGAAATNATLAWLGGGSLASGGLGMAGGTMVLGGLVAGPLLGVAGAVMASKAAAKKDEAYEALCKVRGEIKKLEVVISSLKSIRLYTDECNDTFSQILKLWTDTVFQSIERLAEKSSVYGEMSVADKQIVMESYKIAYSLSDFIKEPVMKEDRVIPKEEQKALNKAKKLFG